VNWQKRSGYAATTRRRGGDRAGLMLIDVLLAGVIVGAVIVVLAAGVTQYGRASARLAEQRQAVYAAEGVLVGLQSGRNVGAVMREGENVRVEEIEGGEEIAGHRWVRVVVVVGEREAELVGVVPAEVQVRP
jgi:hypothetical protein